MATPPIFNRAKQLHARNRIAAAFANHDFLHREVAMRMEERLSDMEREIGTALAMGFPAGWMKFLPADTATADRSFALLRAWHAQGHINGPAYLVDEEAFEASLKEYSFEQQSPIAATTPTPRFDTIISAITLHSVNDLPGALVQLRQQLRTKKEGSKTGGLAMITVFGEHSFYELRRCLTEAETELYGGFTPRVAPSLDIKTLGGLLQRAGFSLPVVDQETITVTYSSLLNMLREVRGMGLGSYLSHTPTPLTRTLLERTEARYRQHFPQDDHRLPVTFDLITMTGLVE